jgi:hypothetical protein
MSSVHDRTPSITESNTSILHQVPQRKQPDTTKRRILLEQLERLTSDLGSNSGITSERLLEDFLHIVLLDPCVDYVLDLSQHTVVVRTPGVNAQVLVKFGGLFEGCLDMTGSCL